jgi:hypothetical protein
VLGCLGCLVGVDQEGPDAVARRALVVGTVTVADEHRVRRVDAKLAEYRAEDARMRLAPAGGDRQEHRVEVVPHAHRFHQRGDEFRVHRVADDRQSVPGAQIREQIL